MERARVNQLVIMMQKEVADRITAVPSTKAYGSLSIAVQYYMDAEVSMIVPKTVFIPQPNVESAVLNLTRREESYAPVTDEDFLFTVTQGSFLHRRKTLWNNLQASLPEGKENKELIQQAFEETGIDALYPHFGNPKPE